MKTPEVPALRTLKIQNTRSLSGASESGAFTGSRQVTTATLGVGHSSGSWSSKRAKLPNEPIFPAWLPGAARDQTGPLRAGAGLIGRVQRQVTTAAGGTGHSVGPGLKKANYETKPNHLSPCQGER